MGAAEPGRELGDASGPLLGASAATLTWCYTAPAVPTALLPLALAARRTPR
ncbi:hypothetical protein ACFVAF_32560 [Streptomyces sp. NPDC057596]|uniref:hypothetical protein n=1 Tax=Streptomyces sp. NPDC057596 TaxID=3346178 RepID=UPI003674937F